MKNVKPIRGYGNLAESAFIASKCIDSSMHKPWYFMPPSQRRLSVQANQRIKRLFEVILCLVALPAVAVILAILCIIIKLDSPGPALFFQKRTGKGGRRFKMYKLRTMVHNAHELKDEYLHLNELSHPDFKISNDPRITGIGGFLRKSSLDELPQILNVLRGDMSLVGPRPTSFGADTYELWHTARLEARPGLTGLWQVLGRNELDFDDRLRLDIAYMRNQTLWLDIRIIIRTVGCVFDSHGAN